jgi:hypothetical protein
LAIVRYVLTAALLASVALTVSPGNTQAQYVAPAVEIGIGAFPMGHPEATVQDFDAMVAAGITWARIPVLWRSIEGACNDCFDWADLDRVVAEASARGIRLIAKVDHQPAWSRAVPAENGPPDNIEDYADVVAQIVGRYAAGSPYGQIPVIEVWNEVNLSREWGDVPITRDTASQYVYMLRRAYEQAKLKDPSVTIISSGLAPTGTADGTAMPDDVYLQWMYEDGLAAYSDGVGLIANGFGIPPATEVMSDPSRPHPSFYFRHIEQMHDIMVLNGDTAQVWIMEHGYTTDNRPDSPYAWHAVPSEEVKGQYIVEAIQYAQQYWTPWVAELTIWTMADPEWTPTFEQYYWAINEPSINLPDSTAFTARESYNVIQRALRPVGAAAP